GLHHAVPSGDSGTKPGSLSEKAITITITSTSTGTGTGTGTRRFGTASLRSSSPLGAPKRYAPLGAPQGHCGP
ncbi:MAG: hypothetical protein KJ052_11100, partial [Candidatus Hydrogenedentes bacterium]|nr:hypothetical protein [Candidatus Hydrogenedentota bacterium]